VSLSRINNLILVAIILLNGYVIAAPFMPSLLFKLQAGGKKQSQLEQLIKQSKGSVSSQASSGAIAGNSVVIPAMLLNQPILEGSIASQYKTLNQGIWRWPLSSTPDQGGNTVLVGHRFTYTIPKGVFYYLNKLKVGDNIGIFWNKHRYLYEVTKVSTVSPNDTSIEQNTKNPELTLFTCTPLLLPKDRLVVTASLENKT
jgi:LPXTG-site transpeptidase (sortase) family protein